MTIVITNKTAAKTNTRTEFHTTRYVANNRDDCRDGTDRNVYDLVVMLGTTITMGQVTGTPA